MISTKETNEIQRENGRWYEKRGRTAAIKISEEKEPKGSSKMQNEVNEKL